ncbi:MULTISPECIES: nitrilase-related carbon-nitrogen hydrolase [unclassified Marinitoga]|uniref:nitrilase-related carbon-nitrogen hydrolase n=1 Tax=unclassified Marinitoga TaxID=2640159 RepID=UPI0006416D44|nr:MULTISPECIES: nitrilase-related carbon-nitrogen hydrolase [unclassified Marinitoga]KLO24227.1 nitrilase [Marinitoga sp. 1155]NUV00439.1 nitrilase [Marinitoga sp. 1154]
MKIGLVQFKPHLFQVKENVERGIDLIKNESADLFVFPELAFTGYTFNTKNEVEWVSENMDGFSIKAFKDFAISKKTNVVFGFVENDNEKFYNSSILIKSDGSHRIYRKTHLFYEEKLFFEKGNTGFWVENINGVKIGLAICFDWFFPESFRTLALKGAQIIAHSANLVMPYCQEANKIRSLENRVFIVTSNRWGEEINALNSNKFTGMSQITNPDGKVIVRFPQKGDKVKIVNINPEEANNKNLNKHNNIFYDRIPEFYK